MTYHFDEIEGFYPKSTRDIKFVVGGKKYDLYGREVPHNQFYCRDIYTENLVYELKEQLDSWIKINPNVQPVDVEIEFWKKKITDCKDVIWLRRYNENLVCATRRKKGMEIQENIKILGMNQRVHKVKAEVWEREAKRERKVQGWLNERRNLKRNSNFVNYRKLAGFPQF